MRGGLGDLMKQAQQLQENMRKAQEELAGLEVTGQAGGGMVTVSMSGRHEVRRVHIDPKLMGEEQEMLEDMVAAAANDAVRKVADTMQERFAGFGLPPGLKSLF
jgi:DNA-binding YbaB/EbfC family protein